MIRQSSLPSPSRPVLHPLANPHVRAVVPFWVKNDEGFVSKAYDFEDREMIFEEAANINENAMLYLTIEELADEHGAKIAERLSGHTGLYVVVENLGPIYAEFKDRVLGQVASIGNIRECVANTAAGLIIFASRPKELSMALAA